MVEHRLSRHGADERLPSHGTQKDMDSLLTVPMPLHPTVEDVVIRILATVIAGGLIGFNRERGGHAAGFRTTILVGLAACLSMVEGNILLSTPVGSDHTAVRLDVLRLALGTLTGVGFIGAGAIMHKGDLVTGVTTAATIWVMTSIGICFGGGQILLGTIATGVAFAVLSPMRLISNRVRRKEKALFTIRHPAGAALPEVAPALKPLGIHSRFLSRHEDRDTPTVVLLTYEATWREKAMIGHVTHLMGKLEQDFDLVSLDVANTET